jgi:fructosamine-3-kinase
MTEDFAARIGALVGVRLPGVREAGTRHGFRHLTGTLADGRGIFVKAAVGAAAPGAFAAEANGLRWLAQAGAVRVPAVLGADESMLVIELLPPGGPTPGAARELGAALARLHAAGAAGFGAPWPGYIASLPLDNTPLSNAEPDWGRWYAQRRLVPYLRRARDGGALSASDAHPVEAVIGRIG